MRQQREIEVLAAPHRALAEQLEMVEGDGTGAGTVGFEIREAAAFFIAAAQRYRSGERSLPAGALCIGALQIPRHRGAQPGLEGDLRSIAQLALLLGRKLLGSVANADGGNQCAAIKSR